MADAAKRLRAGALSSFSRAANNLEQRLSETDTPSEVLKILFDTIEKRYAPVLQKHEDYLSALTDDDDQADEWLEEVELRFEGLQLKYTAFVNQKAADALSAEQGRSLKIKEEDVTETIIKMDDLIRKNCIAESLKRERENLMYYFRLVKAEYAKLMEQIETNENLSLELKSLSGKVDTANQDADKYLYELISVQKAASSSKVRMEKLPLPRFDGNVREYPRFRKEFTDLVMPTLTNAEAVFSLRKCLDKDVETTLGCCNDDIEKMLGRLDNKFGDPRKVVDSIIKDITQFVKIRESDKQSLVKYVDLLERAYLDLMKLKLEKEMSCASVVSLIENKLPDNIVMEWYRKIYKRKIDKSDSFAPLLEFLKTERDATEYSLSKATFLGAAKWEKKERYGETRGAMTASKCWIHADSNSHSIEDCNVYVSMSNLDKLAKIREKGACWKCLQTGHISSKCNSKACGEEGCFLPHHCSLHNAYAEGLSFHIDSNNPLDTCLLLLMTIPSHKGRSVNVMWDSGSSISLITFKKANELSLVGSTVNLSIITAGGETKRAKSCRYELVLLDKAGYKVGVSVYGIPQITSDITPLDPCKVTELFKSQNILEERPTGGEVDVLIGLDHASFHPQKIQNNEHLVVYENRFGLCIGGTHPSIKENTEKIVSQVAVHHIQSHKEIPFFDSEALGVECNPKCGSCRCGNCPMGGKEYNLKEERELKVIEEGLKFRGEYFEASYPWRRDPRELPDNRSAAYIMLIAQEKRLKKSKAIAELFAKEMKDMLDRGVARKLTNDELLNYKGPIHYLTHHEIVRLDHATTKCRIVFNASRNFHGHNLNDYWMKGPDLLNNMLGIILRFREEEVCIVGDVKKMYHSVKISILDQHTHRFLWRELKALTPPSTYVMTAVSFGDKPAGTIAQTALRKAADMSKDEYPEAWKTVTENTYMDDILDSVPGVEEGKKLIKDIDTMLNPKGFVIKSWTICGKKGNSSESTNSKINEKNVFSCIDDEDESANGNQKVLGVKWDLKDDKIYFTVKLDFNRTKKGRQPQVSENHNEPQNVPQRLSKRMILSQINGVFDPMGLSSPFTVKAKILMRRLWMGDSKNLGWDDAIPPEEQKNWENFFGELPLMQNITFNRCIKPDNVSAERPSLIMFSDASERVIGCCSYVRWRLKNGEFASQLIAAKNKVTPVKEMSIVRKELDAAVLSKRLMTFLTKEMRYDFEEIIFLIDSEIVLAMINKESYGFKTYAAIRIGEIQQGTSTKQWFWIDGKLNIADWITRGKAPSELDINTAWQNGLPFMKLPREKWPIRQGINMIDIPEQIGKVGLLQSTVSSTISNLIDIKRFSKYLLLLGTTVRVTSVFTQITKSFKNIGKSALTQDYEYAKVLWIKDAQTEFNSDEMDKKYGRLAPLQTKDGTWVVGTRSEKWMEISYNKKHVVLLPYKHPFSKLYAEYVHSLSHLGVAATTSKIRLQFWIVSLHKMVKSIVYRCVNCRKKRKELLEQKMSPLPADRLIPAPPWHALALDFCGPYTIRGEVNKRSRGKCYLILFNCLITRSVHVDVAADYSRDEFLKTLRRFCALRGRPSTIYSDNGSQIKAASKEMTAIVKGLDMCTLASYGAEEGTSWKFTSPNAPWQNGCSESLIKTLKQCITHAINDNILSFSELQTVVFEVSNIMNERPIGRHPTSPEEGHYLCPNDLLLGRATSRVPQGPFLTNVSNKRRFELVQSIVSVYWKKMIRDYFPALIIQQKWHTSRRNTQVGDIVLIQDTDSIRGNWKLGRVEKVKIDDDGHVRNCSIQYKPTDVGPSVNNKLLTIQRPVQRLVIVLPVEEDKVSD